MPHLPSDPKALFALAFPRQTEGLWAQLQMAYAGEFDDVPRSRHYHVFGHVESMLHSLLCGSIRMGQRERMAAVRSIFYHDAIYRQHAGGSEEASVAWMRSQLHDYPANVRASVALGIRSTIHGKAGPAAFPRWARIVHDIDLLSLADGGRFAASRRKVRREYPFLTDEQFRKGQKKFFRQLLLQGPLYWTAEFSGFEVSAQENLRMHIL